MALSAGISVYLPVMGSSHLTCTSAVISVTACMTGIGNNIQMLLANVVSCWVQEMTQEQLEEMMERQGQSQSQGGKELQISLEQQDGSSPQDSNQQCAPPAITPACPSRALSPEQLHKGVPSMQRSCQAPLKGSKPVAAIHVVLCEWGSSGIFNETVPSFARA